MYLFWSECTKIFSLMEKVQRGQLVPGERRKNLYECRYLIVSYMDTTVI